MRIKRQTFELTPVNEVSVGLSVLQPTTTLFTLLNKQMSKYETCLITYYLLPICIHRFCEHQRGRFLRVQIICEMEYRESINVIIKVSNIDYFHLHTFAVYSVLSTLVMVL